MFLTARIRIGGVCKDFIAINFANGVEMEISGDCWGQDSVFDLFW